MKRILFIALAAVILVPLMVIGIDMFRDPASEHASMPVADTAGQLKRGEYLARAGNCMACHTERGGKEYAGGRAIATPFGNIYSSNLTPDRETGIGTWSADDFWRAIHAGKSKDGQFLYPAFPYPNYTKVTRADADAMYAWFRTLPPVQQANKQHELRFPYNQRILLAFWRTLYFTPGEYRAEANKTAQWNRGAYLVQGLGHCAACHTSRNALGGTVAQADLAGGMIPMLNWYASSLTVDAGSGLGDWDARDIASLLKTGVSQRGAVFGPMAEVVGKSLQHLSEEDIGAMTTYLKSIPKADTAPAKGAVRVSGDTEAVLKQGAKLYEKHCVECHKSDGTGMPPAYPPLAGNHSLSASAINPIRIVLNGGYPPSTAGNPRPYGMPPFGSALNDEEVAAVVSFIRTSWGNKGDVVSPVDVGRFRGAFIE
ncbi:c-type cytochrome [Lacisediminimonas profundi]|uniref:c-type cytochrome n=1 Tax=Lacisediminimonas profundi TaxID=2603856 RepID=UPI00124B1C1E|nr:cytochrome c [Lacisediminimonas profundi]